MNNLTYLFLLFLIYSFLGWVMETILCSIATKQFADRGFLIGPICPIYGYGAVLMTVLLTKFMDTPVALFTMAIVICSVLEYIISYIMEKMFHTRWWDYSNRLFNINGRVCLKNAFAFGILGLFGLYVANPFILSILNKIPFNYLKIMALILFIIIIVDTVISLVVITKFTKTVKLVKKDSSNDINKKVRDLLISKSKLLKRLVRAFPNFKFNK